MTLTHLIMAAFYMGEGAPAPADCRAIADDAERLACYDRTFGSVAGDTGISAGPAKTGAASPDAPQAPAPKSREEEFGLTLEQLEQTRKEGPPTIDLIESQVVAVDVLPRDRFLLKLENGQRWVQVEPTPRQPFYVGDSITIRKAAVGSFLASGARTGTGVRVRRIE